METSPFNSPAVALSRFVPTFEEQLRSLTDFDPHARPNRWKDTSFIWSSVYHAAEGLVTIVNTERWASIAKIPTSMTQNRLLLTPWACVQTNRGQYFCEYNETLCLFTVTIYGVR